MTTCTPRSPVRPCCCASKGRLRLALAASLLQAAHGGSWALFAMWLLAPELNEFGSLAGPAAGVAFYNAAHT